MGAIFSEINLRFIAYFNMLENVFVIVPVEVAFMAVTGSVAGSITAMIPGRETEKSLLHEKIKND
jgi:hypothetical protein